MFQKKKIIAKITDIVSINTLKFKMTTYSWAYIGKSIFFLNAWHDKSKHLILKCLQRRKACLWAVSSYTRKSLTNMNVSKKLRVQPDENTTIKPKITTNSWIRTDKHIQILQEIIFLVNKKRKHSNWSNVNSNFNAKAFLKRVEEA